MEKVIPHELQQITYLIVDINHHFQVKEYESEFYISKCCKMDDSVVLIF